MKTDAAIRQDVETELKWDPAVDDKEIGVAVHNGVVTLTGHVPSYAARWAAEDVSKRLSGVRAIANELDIRIPMGGERSDTDIAEAAANALRWSVITSGAPLKAVVSKGHVTLSGEAQWGYQRMTAERTVRNLMGVKGVSNLITIKKTVMASDVKQKIEDAFKRHAVLDAKDIQVDVHDSTVTLKGRVRNWQEREEAALAAWGAPGVGLVENQLSLQ